MRNLLPILLLLMTFQANGQDSTLKFQISFTDKNNSPYSLDQPLDFLSTQAVQRRQKYLIALDWLDLPVTPDYVAGLQQSGARILFTTKWFNSAVIALEDSSLLADILSLPYVKDVDYRGKMLGTQINMLGSTDLSTLSQADYGKSYNQINMMYGQWLHDQGYMGQGVPIAVLDAGFTATDQMQAFGDLRSRNGILGTRDFHQDTISVYHFASHGTYVLSVMAGMLPYSLTGTAPAADYYLLRTERGESEFLIEELAWAAGAEFADSAGAWLINSSLGYQAFDDSTMNHTYDMFDGNTTLVTQAADIAARKGILVVNSAGNQGNSAFGKITAPADADSILTVGAVTPTGEYAGFSSRGPSADGRIKPEVAAQGVEVEAATLDDNGTLHTNGTSLSAPLITGLAACLWQAFPQLNNMQIRDAIIQSASQYHQPDSFLGYGIPDFYVAYQICRAMTGQKIADEQFVYLANLETRRATVRFFTQKAGDINAQLVDRTGRVLERWKIYSPGLGTLKYHFSIPPDTSPGVYFLTFQNQQKIYTVKLMLF